MLDDDLGELRTAEEFLDYFGVTYDPTAMSVNRLRILKRFHDYIQGPSLPLTDDERRATYAALMEQAYADCLCRAEPLPPPAEDGDGGRPAVNVSFVPLSDVLM